MIPLALKLSGFLSYWDTVELDFTGFDLACISGANGAGKSSLLDAITWALFGQARRRDDALINSHTNQAEVVFDFQYEDSIYRIQRIKPRDKATLLEFFIRAEDGSLRALTEHSLRETEQRIQQTLRLDYETFTNASFFLQGRADQFAQQRPGDRKRILSNILGLEIWDVYQKNASDRRKGLETEQTRLDSVLQEIQAELDQEIERRKRLQILEDSLGQASALRKAQENALNNLRRLADSLAEQRRLVEMFTSQVETARQSQQGITLQLAERQVERQEFISRIAAAAEIEAAYRRWQDARTALEQWEQTAANFRQVEARRAMPIREIDSERTRLESEENSLLELQEQAAAEEARLPLVEAELNTTAQAVLGLEQRLAQRAALESERLSLSEQASEAQAENRRLKQDMEELKTRIDRLQETSGAECPLCGQPLSPADRQQLIVSLERQGREQGDHYRANLECVRQSEEQRRQVDGQIAALQALDADLRQRQRAHDQLENQLSQVRQAAESWRAGGALRLTELARQLAENDYAPSARAALAEIDTELQDLGYDIAAHEAARQAEVEGRASEEQLRRLESARAALAPLEREIAGLEKQAAAGQAHLAELETRSQQAADKYAQDSANLPNLNQAENELYALQEQENRLRSQVGGATQAVEVLKTQRARQEELNRQRETLGVQISRYKTLEKAFGKDGVPALLIEQALPEIETQANEILDRLSSGGMSVRFATQKDFKDKNREDKKETLDILISDAAGTREYELFSGGEAFRINFAIRLALSRVLAHRSGARLQTLVIDEGFGSQDGEGRQRLIEAINLVRTDFARVLVITHLEELKEAFPARIEVDKTPRGSQLRVLA